MKGRTPDAAGLAVSAPPPKDNGDQAVRATRRRRLVVVADDYAITPGVARAIRSLLGARRISATSVMAASEFWPAEAAALRAAAGGADVGLHVTLTDQSPLGPMPRLAPAGRLPSLAALYGAGLMRRLPLAEIAAEIERQTDSFTVHFGRPPAYFDGHHHVHQLPGVRDIVIALAARLGRGSVWVRCCRERPALVARRGVATAKSLVIGAFGQGLARRARLHGVPVNDGFSGAYDFAAEMRSFGELARRFVMGARENSVMMCHPGYADAALAARDAMTSARDGEHAYLMSEAWPALLVANGLELGPFRHHAG